VKLPLDKLYWQSFEVEKLQDGSQIARFEATIENQDSGSAIVKLIKSYKIIPNSYLMDFSFTIENLTSAEQIMQFNLAGPIGIGKEDPRSDDRKIVAGFITDKSQVISSRMGIDTTFLSRNLGLKDATKKIYRGTKQRG